MYIRWACTRSITNRVGSPDLGTQKDKQLLVHMLLMFPFPFFSFKKKFIFLVAPLSVCQLFHLVIYCLCVIFVPNVIVFRKWFSVNEWIMFSMQLLCIEKSGLENEVLLSKPRAHFSFTKLCTDSYLFSSFLFLF